MDDIGFDVAHSQPPGQPEAVPASLEREGDPCDRPADLYGLVPPPLDQLQKCILIWIELLQRVALDSRYNPSNEPARLAHINNHNERALLAERSAGPAQIVRLCHGALHRLTPA